MNSDEEFGRHLPRRRVIQRGRGSLAQRLMGAFMVVLPAEAVESSLLSGLSRLWRACGLRFEGPVHPFMTAILLGPPRLDPLVPDASVSHPVSSSPPDVDPLPSSLDAAVVVTVTGPWLRPNPASTAFTEHAIGASNGMIQQRDRREAVARAGVGHGKGASSTPLDRGPMDTAEVQSGIPRPGS